MLILGRLDLELVCAHRVRYAGGEQSGCGTKCCSVDSTMASLVWAGGEKAVASICIQSPSCRPPGCCLRNPFA
jgi:hypothetical protein